MGGTRVETRGPGSRFAWPGRRSAWWRLSELLDLEPVLHREQDQEDQHRAQRRLHEGFQKASFFVAASARALLGLWSLQMMRAGDRPSFRREQLQAVNHFIGRD